jgi:hypothetical protein
VVSLVSSAGAGKTALREKTLAGLKPTHRVAALVGDLATDNDAARLARAGVPVRQITRRGRAAVEGADHQQHRGRGGGAGLREPRVVRPLEPGREGVQQQSVPQRDPDQRGRIQRQAGGPSPKRSAAHSRPSGHAASPNSRKGQASAGPPAAWCVITRTSALSAARKTTETAV